MMFAALLVVTLFCHVFVSDLMCFTFQYHSWGCGMITWLKVCSQFSLCYLTLQPRRAHLDLNQQAVSMSLDILTVTCYLISYSYRKSHVLNFDKKLPFACLYVCLSWSNFTN